MEEQEKIYVFVVEGTIYQSEEETKAVLTQEEWDALDKTRTYRITPSGQIIPEETPQTPEQVPQVLPPLSLDMMYVQATVGDTQRLDALWDLIVKQDRTKVDVIATKRVEVEQEYRRQMEVYEANK